MPCDINFLWTVVDVGTHCGVCIKTFNWNQKSSLRRIKHIFGARNVVTKGYPLFS